MMKRIVFILLAIIFWKEGISQIKTTTSPEQIWTGYFNQTRLGKRIGVWFDAQYRTQDEFTEGSSTLIIRPGLTYYVNDALKLTAGYGFINHYPQDNFIVSRPEHRPWQQVQWHSKYGRNRVAQYFRLEERFRRKIAPDSTLAAGRNFNFRVRYNFLWQIPLTKKEAGKGGVSLILNDEVHVAFGKEVVYNYFDQNRLFAGFAWHLNNTDNLQIGYLNVFQQLPAGNRYRSIHAARIFYFHNLDLRKK